MSDTVLIVLIVAVTILLVLFMFRNQLRRFFVRANPEGFEASIETQQTKPINPSENLPSTDASSQIQPAKPASVTISGNTLLGKNKIGVKRDDVNVSDNRVVGENEIAIDPPTPPAEDKPKKGKQRK